MLWIIKIRKNLKNLKIISKNNLSGSPDLTLGGLFSFDILHLYLIE